MREARIFCHRLCYPLVVFCVGKVDGDALRLKQLGIAFAYLLHAKYGVKLVVFTENMFYDFHLFSRST